MTCVTQKTALFQYVIRVYPIDIQKMTQKTALFQYVIRVYPIDIQKTRAGLLPPLFRTIYEQQLN